MTRFVHLPPTGTDPHRWINPEAVEWFAAMGVESIIRLRTGDTLRTSMSVTALGDKLAQAGERRPLWFEPHDQYVDQIEGPPGDPL
jgi:hypothetical protein